MEAGTSRYLCLMKNKQSKSVLLTAVKVTAQDTTKDFSKYSIRRRGRYGKGQMVLNVIKDYVQNHRVASAKSLERLFPKSVQGRYGVVNTLDSADKKRFFTKDDQVLTVGKDKVVVSREWDVNNIKRFIENNKAIGGPPISIRRDPIRRAV